MSVVARYPLASISRNIIDNIISVSNKIEWMKYNYLNRPPTEAFYFFLAYYSNGFGAPRWQ